MNPHQRQQLDNLEVAKLATLVGSQLSIVDKQTDGSSPANRIDKRRFIEKVVNPNAPDRFHNPSVNSYEEAEMLKFLNHQAMMQNPDVSVGSSAAMIPQIPMPSPIPVPAPLPQQIIPPPSSQLGHSEGVVYSEPVIRTNPNNINLDSLAEIANAVKSIDKSLKDLCDFFIQKVKKKKKMKRKTSTKTTEMIVQNIPTQVSSTTSKLPETPVVLLQETQQ